MSTSTKIPIHKGSNANTLISFAEEDLDAASLRNFSGYAPPMAWGPDVTVASHIGSVTYRITYQAIGDTIVIGRVHYYKNGSSEKVVEEFRDSTLITTSNSLGSIIVDFKGVATGSAVEGTIVP